MDLFLGVEMKVICVMGAPASGKSTLMETFIAKLGKSTYHKVSLITYHCWDDKKIMVLGDYRKRGFSGTDTMSMACQPVAVGFLQALEDDWTVIFEGDRLCNVSFLTECKNFSDLTCWVLEVSEETKVLRHKIRKDTQNETWLRGRETKVKKVASTFNAIPKKHETLEDTQNIVNELLKIVDK